MDSNAEYSATWQRRILANFDYLVDNLTSLKSLTDCLISKLSFTLHDADFVQHGGTDRTQRECNRRFLNTLLNKNSAAYDVFIEALKWTFHDFIMEKLNSTDTSEAYSDDSGTTTRTLPAGNVSSPPRRTVHRSARHQPEWKSVQSRPVHVSVYRPKNVFMGGEHTTLFCTTDNRESVCTKEICSEKLLVALVKEILYHCPCKKEALFTLEEKLCAKLREVLGKHVVSFEEYFPKPFKEFLENNTENFEITKQGNDLIVSRVNVGKCVVQTTDENMKENAHESAKRKEPNGGDTAAPKKKETQANTCTNTQKENLVTSSATQFLKEAPADNSVTSFLSREPSDTLIFKLSADVYMRDHLQFTIDIVSLWNTPDRDQAFIILGVKPLVSPPHQVVGLRSGSTHAFYQKIFLRQLFDSMPKFAYRETMHEGKRVGIIQMERSAGSISPSIVVNNTKSPKLQKGQLWLRKGGKNITVTGSDTPDSLFQKVYSSFLRSPEQNAPCVLDSNVSCKRSGPQKFVSDLGSATNQSAKGNNTSADTLVPEHKQNTTQKVISRKTMCSQNTRLAAVGRQEKEITTAANLDSLDSSATLGVEADLENPDSHITGPSPETGDLKTASEENNTAMCRSEDMSCTMARPTDSNTADRNSFDTAVSMMTNPHGTTTSTQIAASVEASSHGQQKESKQTSELMKSLAFFKKGHFILLCGTLPDVAPNLDALSRAPWIAVFDFDVNSRKTGLLAYLEEGLSQTRSTNVSTWMDPHSGITERGTQWWSLRGRLDIPDSNLSDLSPLKWLQKVCDKIEKLSVELARFSQDYTVLSILVLWPNSKEEIKCMQKFLSKLLERIHVQPSILLWFTDSRSNQADAFEVKSIAEDSEDEVKLFHLGLEEFCTEVENALGNTSNGVFLYQLPSEDGTLAGISLKQAAFLKQDFEVLYLQNPYSKENLTAEDLQKEGDHFFRGGSINWFARYDMGPTCFDVERNISKQITGHIKNVYIKGFKGGVVRLYHAPGSGGSTMSQRLLFDLHEVTPCVHVKQRSGSSTEEVADRLAFLYDHTHMPVVALLDGEEEEKLRQLQAQLRRCTVIFLYVKRYPYPIAESRQCIEPQSKFFLQGVVNRQESRNLVVQFGHRCNGSEAKLRALSVLDKDVQQSQQKHQMFEYGLTVYDHEYQGLRAYVKGYLQIEQNQGAVLKPWQKGLGYLSLVYHYAQASLPCQFIGSLMGKSTKGVLSVHDLPHPVPMLVVLDTNEGKSQYVRIMHYAIATEILEQILNKSSERSGDGTLSNEAKRNLKSFCINFLDDTMRENKKSSLSASSVMHILTKTFIVRDMVESVDSETEVKRSPQQFSQLMLDLDSKAPHNGRLEVLQKLCDVCPDNPNLIAHLGRFYSLCQPDKEDEAERSFKLAIKLALENNDRQGSELKDQYGQDLMYIYHMFACFLRRRVQRRIAVVQSSQHSGEESAFQSRLDEIIADADQACQNFALSRDHSPPSNCEAHPYFNEMDIRLHTCRFILHKSPGGSHELLQSWRQFGEDYKFVTTSIFEIEDLIMECYNKASHEDGVVFDLQKRVRTFNTLFRGCVNELQALANDNPLTTLRLKITAKKLQYDRPDRVIFVENPLMPPEVMEYVIDTYQQIFDHEVLNHDTVKTKLELDYRDWILAIRNPNFQRDYTMERVLDDVRRWRSSARSPQSMSIFYEFVLLSLLGFGTSTKSGHEGCLRDAFDLKEAMKKLSRTDPGARQPREWLGREECAGIRRLVSNSHIPHENRKVTGTAGGKLAVCKGTVVGKAKSCAGFINMDIRDNDSKRPVKVFFVPACTDTVLSFNKGARVQFYLGFTQENGYEAFEVTLLKRSQCPECRMWVEVTTDQISVLCHGRTRDGKVCGADVLKKQ